jgi:hypothetical protein
MAEVYRKGRNLNQKLMWETCFAYGPRKHCISGCKNTQAIILNGKREKQSHHEGFRALYGTKGICLFTYVNLKA